MYLLNKQFWIATMERGIKTFVQALIAAFGVGQISGAVGADVAAIDWRGALSLAVSAALLSVLMSVGSGPIGAVNSPSVVPGMPLAAAPAAVLAAAVQVAPAPIATVVESMVQAVPAQAAAPAAEALPVQAVSAS